MTDPKPSFTDRLRPYADRILVPIGTRLHRIGMTADIVTIAGVLVVGLASVLIGRGDLRAGGLLLLLGLPLDALDGAVARAGDEASARGAFLDSTLDRYADGFIFVALSYYFAVSDQFLWLVLAQWTLISTLLVSYTRARAEGLGVDCRVGWFTRVERTLVILVMMLVPILLSWGLMVLAIGTGITVWQRMRHVTIILGNRGD